MNIKFSDNRKNLMLALLEFNKQVEPIFRNQEAKIKTKTGGEMRYRFSDLSSIQTEINPALNANGLIVIQSPVDKFKLETTITHAESGEYMSACYEMIPAGNTPQAHGSTITYMKRYALIAMLNLIVKDDDDGQKGSQKPLKIKGEEKLKNSEEIFFEQFNRDEESFFRHVYKCELDYRAKTGNDFFNVADFLCNHYNLSQKTKTTIEEQYTDFKLFNTNAGIK